MHVRKTCQLSDAVGRISGESFGAQQAYLVARPGLSRHGESHHAWVCNTECTSDAAGLKADTEHWPHGAAGSPSQCAVVYNCVLGLWTHPQPVFSLAELFKKGCFFVFLFSTFVVNPTICWAFITSDIQTTERGNGRSFAV